MKKRNFHTKRSCLQLILSSSLFLLSTTHSIAAYLPPAANWGGPYLGVQLGGGWNRSDWRFTNNNYYNTLGATLLGSNFNFSASGAVGGIDAGYNFQSGPYVFGFEGSILDVDLSDGIVSPYFPATDYYTSKLRWLATAKARAGYAYMQWLGFVTGGWAGSTVALTTNDNVNAISANTSPWLNGWTLGAGVDYKLTHALSVGLAYEYMRMKIDHEATSCANCGVGVGFGNPTVTGTLNTQTVTARLNYSLG